MTPTEINTENKIIIALFGEPYQALKDINGVKVGFRTLFDYEIFDCIKRANRNPEPNERDFDQNRWKLAYSLISVNEIPLPVGFINDRLDPKILEEKYKIICSWLNVYVVFLSVAFDEVVQEEIDLVEELKKDSGTQTMS